MRTWAAIIVLGSALHAQTVVDRIAVTVDKHVIAESAVILRLRVSAFIFGMPVDLSPAAKREAAEVLVDEYLMLREATESFMAMPANEDVTAMVARKKRDLGGELGYQNELKRHEITENDLKAQYLSGLTSSAFSDSQFGAALQLTEEDLRAYYERVKGAASFEESRPKLEADLKGARVIQALDGWLASARAKSNIRFVEKAFQ